MREPIQENLLEELTRLVGRPLPVVHEALASLLSVLSNDFPEETLTSLAEYPMTAWQALAPHDPGTRRLWSAAVATGLTPEESYTALAVIDDHVRRGFGADAWQRVKEWAPRLAGRYDLDAHVAANPSRTPISGVRP
ncbi:MAG: hypothetical protein U0V87_09015 [Acidobacteriota bacterium]